MASAQGKAASDAYDIALLINANKNRPMQLKIRLRPATPGKKPSYPGKWRRCPDRNPPASIDSDRAVRLLRIMELAAFQCSQVRALTFQILAGLLSAGFASPDVRADRDREIFGDRCGRGSDGASPFMALISLQLGSSIYCDSYPGRGRNRVACRRRLNAKRIEPAGKAADFQAGFIFLIILMESSSSTILQSSSRQAELHLSIYSQYCGE